MAHLRFLDKVAPFRRVLSGMVSSLLIPLQSSRRKFKGGGAMVWAGGSHPPPLASDARAFPLLPLSAWPYEVPIPDVQTHK
eukprot:939205-Amphidinium_carterae.1